MRKFIVECPNVSSCGMRVVRELIEKPDRCAWCGAKAIVIEMQTPSETLKEVGTIMEQAGLRDDERVRRVRELLAKTAQR